MNAEKEIEWVKEDLIPNILESGILLKYHNGVAANSIRSDKFTLIDVKITLIDTNEAFMLTNCYKAAINYNYDGINYSDVLIVKKTPNVPDDVYDSVNFDALFKNEIIGYKILMPKLLEFNKSLFKNGSLRNHPKYYYSKLDKHFACVVLGDFVADGWSMTKSRINLTLEHILLAVQLLGHFHGINYALKHKHLSEFNEIQKTFHESRFSREPPPHWLLSLNSGGQRTVSKAKHYYSGKISRKFYDDLDKVLSNFYIYGKERCQPVEPYANICHGDYLRNNIAFKYQSSSETPIDVMMFDFQTLRYASPMIDLAILLCLSADKNVRAKCFDQIFETYWTEMTRVFKENTNLQQIPEFLSSNNMLKEYTMYLPYGIGVASCFLCTLHDSKNETSEEVLCPENKTMDQIVEELLTTGGEAVDKELAAMALHLYELSEKLKINPFEGFL